MEGKAERSHCNEKYIEGGEYICKYLDILASNGEDWGLNKYCIEKVSSAEGLKEDISLWGTAGIRNQGESAESFQRSGAFRRAP